MFRDDKLAHARGVWIASKVAAGWKPYLMTFLFYQIPGSERHKMRVMEEQIDFAYGILISRAIKHPRQPCEDGNRPIRTGAFDYPVAKDKKVCARLIKPNDGLHAHAIDLISPYCAEKRMPDAAAHYVKLAGVYRKRCPLIAKVDCKPIERNPAYVDDYVHKTVLKGRFPGEDRTFIFPRARSELTARLRRR